MTDLSRLKVSLTKHNAHKIARLLREYQVSELFNRLDEIHADRAQARKNLSALVNDVLPPVWASVQALGAEAIDALVLVAIIFSHAKLIRNLMKAGDRIGLSGIVRRGQDLDDKEYTNLARVFDQLGFLVAGEYETFTFDFTPLFRVPGLGSLVGELLELKLATAGWNRSNSLHEELDALDLSSVFGISSSELSDWISVGALPSEAKPILSQKDEAFFSDQKENFSTSEFLFRPGHTERDIDAVDKAASSRSKANRLHNELQNGLYRHLRIALGASCVGTEQPTGSGTFIDLVTCFNQKTSFYEIKTGASVRSNIRQALPQLLEYAFWPEDNRADELIIVSHLPETDQGRKYIAHLVSKFGLPISYRQFDISSGLLK